MDMRSEWQEYTGFGELLCLVLVWTVAVAAVWADFSGRGAKQSTGSVAATSTDRPPASRLD